jgi:hypothetical protein
MDRVCHITKITSIRCFQLRPYVSAFLRVVTRRHLRRLKHELCQSYFTTGDLPPISSSWRQALWDPRPEFFSPTEHLRSLSLCNVLSDERTCLSFIIAADPRQRSHSRVRVPRDSWPRFTVPDSRQPQTWRQGPRAYIPQEQGGPVIPPGTGFPFRRLLRLHSLRWRYWNPPPHGIH